MAVSIAQSVRRTRTWNTATVVLAVSLFIAGGCGMVYEYTLSTLSTYILGNAVEQFSMFIGLMMFMMAVAGWVQRQMTDDKLVDKFILVETLLALMGGFAPLAIYASYGLMEDHFQLVMYSFVLAIGFGIGLEIPLAMRINEKYTTLGTNIASTWAFDYVGSLVGSLAFALVLIKHFSLMEISFLIAFANLFIALMTYVFFLRKGLIANRWMLKAVLAITGVALIYGFTHNVAWDQTLEQRLYDDKIVFSQTTKYQRLVMTYNSSLKEHRFYINGNLQFSSMDEAIYHEQLIHPVMGLVPDHKRVLVLGGGDGLALREILKYKDVNQVTLVDLDPDMVKICSTNPIMAKMNNNSFADARVKTFVSPGVASTGMTRTIYQETGKMVPPKDGHGARPEIEAVAEVEVYNLDADRFISKTAGKWNVVIVDLPDPTSIELAKLYSKEFYLKVRRILAENGAMVIQSTSPYHAKEAYTCILRTVKAAGFDTVPYHDNVPSFGDWGYILASKTDVSDKPLTAKINSVQSFSVTTRYLKPEVFKRATVFGKGWLDSDSTDISTLMHPTILEHYIKESWRTD